GTLRNEQMSNATGIFNLMRNIGGGIGISLSTTMIARFQQFHQNNLVGHVSKLDPAFTQTFNSIKSGLGAMTDPYTAGQQAYGVIYGIVQRQASLLAFVDIFRWEAIICLCCVPLVFLLKKSRGKAPVGVH